MAPAGEALTRLQVKVAGVCDRAPLGAVGGFALCVNLVAIQE